MIMPPGENQLTYLNIKISYLVLSAGLLLSLTHLGRKYLIDELEKYANYDTLTHLLNRKSMDGYMRDAIEKAEKEGSRFCIAMVDIDDFKHVNDTYGHDFGDEVLKYVSHTILMGIKKTDSCFRWGGEEICILFTTNMEQARAASERIMNDISRDSVRYKDKEDVYVTVTIGISEYSDGQTIKSMMEEADARLYWGKRHGKSQVVTQIRED
jgi:diguanylate cyclase (GGDEF)-like protein